MVSLYLENNKFLFYVTYLHKLWAFKGSLSIATESVIRAYQDESDLDIWKGLRLPGIYVPGLPKLESIFKERKKLLGCYGHIKTIIIELRDEDYKINC